MSILTRFQNVEGVYRLHVCVDKIPISVVCLHLEITFANQIIATKKIFPVVKEIENDVESDVTIVCIFKVFFQITPTPSLLLRESLKTASQR
jgi:hypothetical protein